MSLDRAAVLALLANVKDPESGRSITQLEQVHDLQVSGSDIALKLGLTTHSAPLWDETRDEVTALLKQNSPAATSP